MTMPRIIRVFPRKTKATPTDALAYFGPPDRLAEADEVHVSVTFTYDKEYAEHLAEQWKRVAPVKIGGVAYGDRGAEFVPGRYIKPGYVFTSRGCPRRCWFCSVWKRDPVPRLLPIIDGWNILDDNLLACPRDHVEAVFAMLRRQNRRIEFTGGLEALSLQDYQVGLLASLRPRPTMFFAYDPGDEFETLRLAASRLLSCRFHARLASHAGLRADRLPEGHVRRRRAAPTADVADRLHAVCDALAARDAVADEVGTRGKLAHVPAPMGSTCHHPRAGNARLQPLRHRPSPRAGSTGGAAG